jgi:hypothetical protein
MSTAYMDGLSPFVMDTKGSNLKKTKIGALSEMCPWLTLRVVTPWLDLML